LHSTHLAALLLVRGIQQDRCFLAFLPWCRLSSVTWNPITSPWTKQLTWLRIWRLMCVFGAVHS